MPSIAIIINIAHARRRPETVASGNVKPPETDIRPKYGNALHIGGLRRALSVLAQYVT